MPNVKKFALFGNYFSVRQEKPTLNNEEKADSI